MNSRPYLATTLSSGSNSNSSNTPQFEALREFWPLRTSQTTKSRIPSPRISIYILHSLGAIFTTYSQIYSTFGRCSSSCGRPRGFLPELELRTPQAFNRAGSSRQGHFLNPRRAAEPKYMYFPRLARQAENKFSNHE